MLGSRSRLYTNEDAPAPAATSAPTGASLPPYCRLSASCAADTTTALSSYFTVPGAADEDGEASPLKGSLTFSGSGWGGNESVSFLIDCAWDSRSGFRGQDFAFWVLGLGFRV